MSVIHKALRWGTREYFGPASLTDGQAGVHGINTAFAWSSDVADMQEAIMGSLHIMCPTGATAAQLVVPSTSTGLGLLFTAVTTGTTTVSITVNAPSGATSSVAVVGSAITISPSTTANNASILQLINSNTAASALVTASLWGWQVDTSPYDSLLEQPTDPSGVDLINASGFATTTLSGGSASSAPSGVLAIWGSNLLRGAQLSTAQGSSWVHLTNYDMGLSGTGPAVDILSDLEMRWLQARWVPNSGGSTGMLFGAWMGKGNTR